MENFELAEDNYLVSTDKSRLDLNIIHHFLSSESYWAREISMENVEKRIKSSLCFGVYDGDQQLGFGRVLSDFCSIAYVADVFVLKEHRGKGLSKLLMKAMLAHPDLQNLRRWVLATADAHRLYKKFGFKKLDKPDRWMERYDPNAYLIQAVTELPKANN